MSTRRRERYGYTAEPQNVTAEEVRRIAREEARALFHGGRFFDSYEPGGIPLAALEAVACEFAIASVGPLPVSGTFTKVRDDTMLLVAASGSGFHAAGGAVIGADVSIDGVLAAELRGFTNEAASHKPFVPQTFPIPSRLVTNPGPIIAAGQHQLTITAISGTGSDGNDFFYATTIEIAARKAD